MPSFGIPEAAHFCSGFAATQGRSLISFRSFCDSLTTGRTFDEGTLQFTEFRDWSLREVERQLFLSMSFYRRVFDLMIPSASGLAHITMYYGTFFAATSLLGMFGNWKLKGDRIVDVIHGAPGNQRLAVRRFPTAFSGPHRIFWDFFYAHTSNLAPWVDPSFRFALSPVLGSNTWQIDQRNEVNYDSYEACQLASAFQRGFRRTRFPASLPSALNTQFRLLDALIRLASSFAQQFGIRTDALDQILPVGTRREKVRRLILDQRLPVLERHVRRKPLLM